MYWQGITSMLTNSGPDNRPRLHNCSKRPSSPERQEFGLRTQRNMAVAHGLNGRMEKRLPVAVVVHLGDVQDDPVNAAELTYTENVSAHGACVISKRAWQPGEPAQVTSFKEQAALRGKVVHCRKCNNDRYVVGLTFEGCEITWEIYRNYALS
jgi:hypothetical protein